MCNKQRHPNLPERDSSSWQALATQATSNPSEARVTSPESTISCPPRPHRTRRITSSRPKMLRIQARVLNRKALQKRHLGRRTLYLPKFRHQTFSTLAWIRWAQEALTARPVTLSQNTLPCARTSRVRHTNNTAVATIQASGIILHRSSLGNQRRDMCKIHRYWRTRRSQEAIRCSREGDRTQMPPISSKSCHSLRMLLRRQKCSSKP